EAGAHRPGFVHRWLNIDADFAFRFRPSILDPFEQRAQLIADHVVIVVAPGVAGDFAGLVPGRPANAGGSDFIVDGLVDPVATARGSDTHTDIVLMRRVVIQRDHYD